MSLQTLYSYFGDVLRLSLEEFAERHGDAPWIMVEPYAQDTGQTRVATVSGGKAAPTQRSVGRIQKREGGNAFANMVTLGRMANNDIHLPAPDVSGFHAYFLIQPDGSLQLADANSSFGTTVDGVRLESQKPVPIRIGQTIQFATVQARLVDVAEVFEHIKIRPRE
jgi:pSer/pThr/pTyr-binding forkhead associated (FHA) protein